MREVSFKNNNGQSLKGWFHIGNDNKNVILVLHGFPGDAKGGSLERCKVLEKNNLNAFRFEFSGCGDSEGKSEECSIISAFEDTKSAISFLEKEGFMVRGIIGSSFGGSVALLTTINYPKINKLVLCAPAPDLTHPEYEEFTTLEEWKSKGFYDVPDWYNPDNKFRIGFQFYLDAKNNIMYEPSKKVQAKTLIIHGSNDECVPIKQSQKLAKNMPCALIITLKGANHKLEIDNSRGKANKLMLDWFLD